jgi:hypothetical protein
MKIIRLNSNNCGGFRPPKGHLDTQMYPECEGTETDRNIVKKTVEKRKKKKKKKKSKRKSCFEPYLRKIALKKEALRKEAKHGSQTMRVLDGWRDKTIKDRDFVVHVAQLVYNGHHHISEDPLTRKILESAIAEVKQDQDWNKAAEKIARALGQSEHTDESHYKTATRRSFNLKGHNS